MKRSLWCIVVGLIAIHPMLWAADDSTVKVASKLHTESVIMDELMTQLMNHAGADAVHLREFGGTHIIWKPLLRGEVDLYVDYTGTIMKELFPEDNLKTIEDIRRRLLQDSVLAMAAFSFNNTYAISMKSAVAARYGITKVSDLRHYPELRFGFSETFMARNDGWEGLRRTYQLPQTQVRGLDH